MRVRKDDDMPERMKRGNEARPDRVPTEGHEGPTAVPREQWREANRRMDHAKEMTGDADELSLE